MNSPSIITIIAEKVLTYATLIGVVWFVLNFNETVIWKLFAAHVEGM